MAWPLDSLLADTEWWDTWLPRLGELMGRDTGFDPNQRQVVDDRGYVDLMAQLFTPVDGVTWRELVYPAAAMADTVRVRSGKSSQPATFSERAEERINARAQVWEPVVRHVARALAALEATERPDADAYRAPQVQVEIARPWVGILRSLLGPSSRELLDRLGTRPR